MHIRIWKWAQQLQHMANRTKSKDFTRFKPSFGPGNGGGVYNSMC